MMSVNLREGKVYLNDELKRNVADQRPYEEWVAKAITPLQRMSFKDDITGYINRFVNDPVVKKKALDITIANTKPIGKSVLLF